MAVVKENENISLRTSSGMCFPGVAGTPVMKSFVIKVLITTDR